MMELNHTEQMALFEGLMDAEYRKLKPQFPRCRFKKELFPEGIYLHIQNGRRHCDVEVGTGIHINCWRNERYGRDDDLCSWSYNPPKDDQVAELSRYLQEVHFPCWNSRSAALMSCFQPSGSNRLCGHDTCSAVWWSRLRRGRRFHPDRRE